MPISVRGGTSDPGAALHGCMEYAPPFMLVVSVSPVEKASASGAFLRGCLPLVLLLFSAGPPMSGPLSKFPHFENPPPWVGHSVHNRSKAGP